MILGVRLFAQGALVELGPWGGAPASFGDYGFKPFASDTNPLGATLDSVASPLGGRVQFRKDQIPTYTQHWTIGNGWASWGQDYTGDVYSDLVSTGLTITLPAQTGAFYFYAEPDPQYPIPITVTDDLNDTLVTFVNGSGQADGFVIAAPLGKSISTLRITSLYPFAVGEFGIAAVVPESASQALIVGLGLFAIGVGRSAWRR